MWYSSTVVTDLDEEILSPDEAKARCRVDSSDDDAVIGGLIEEVIVEAETYCNIRLRRREVVSMCDSFADFGRMPEGPLAADAVLSISYVDPSGIAQTLPDSSYELRVDGLDSSILRRSGLAWPAKQHGSRISVTLIVGFETLPADIRLALLLKIAERYERREPASRQGMSDWDALLVNYRRGA